MMSNIRLYKLNHATYLCQYHIVWTTRYRGKILADKYIKLEMKRIFKLISKWKGFIIIKWHVGDEHIHLYISIPPKHSVSYAIGILKGKSSSWIKKKNKKMFPKGSLWSRGYFVSTIGLNEFALRKYIENQEKYKVEMQKLPFIDQT